MSKLHILYPFICFRDKGISPGLLFLAQFSYFSVELGQYLVSVCVQHIHMFLLQGEELCRGRDCMPQDMVDAVKATAEDLGTDSAHNLQSTKELLPIIGYWLFWVIRVIKYLSAPIRDTIISEPVGNGSPMFYHVDQF